MHVITTQLTCPCTCLVAALQATAGRAEVPFKAHTLFPDTPILAAALQASAGMGGTYTSKMEDFAHFVAHSKYSALPLQSSRAEGALRSSSSPNSAASCQQAGSSQASQGSSSTRQAACEAANTYCCQGCLEQTPTCSQQAGTRQSHINIEVLQWLPCRLHTTPARGQTRCCLELNQTPSSTG